MYTGTSVDDDVSVGSIASGGVQVKQQQPMDMAKLLNAEMKLHCKSIQEKHLIERRRPQQAYSAVTGETVSVWFYLKLRIECF